MLWLRLLSGIAIVALVAWATARPDSGKSTYPSQPIHVVVPFKQGGESDTFARIIQRGIEKENLLPVPLVIINRPGTSGTVGSRHVLHAEPDGYTVLLLHDALLMAKRGGQADYGAEAFAPVAATGRTGLLIVVPEDSHFKNLTMLMDEISTKPNTVLFGANMAAPVHFAAAELETTREGAAFRYTQVGSGADRYEKLVGRKIDVTVFSIGEYLRYRTKDGKQVMRALAYFGEERHHGLPEIPTAKEQGFPLEMSNMNFWWMPKGTPQKRIDYLADVLEKVMKTEYVKKQLDRVKVDPFVLRGEKLQTAIRKRTESLENVSLRPFHKLPDIPMILLVIVLGLSILLGIVTFLSVGTTKPREPTSTSVSGNRWLLLSCLGVTLLYVVALSIPGIHFPPATVAFVLGFGWILTRFRLSTWPVLEIIALFLGLGMYYLLTQVFVVDLP